VSIRLLSNMATSRAYDPNDVDLKKDSESLKFHQLETGTKVTEDLLSPEEDRRILRRVDL
jgi:hypothetical protein